MDKPPALSPEEAMRRIHHILDYGGSVVPAYIHCRSDRMIGRNVTDPDILKVLRTGAIHRSPVWNKEYRNWRYRVEGYDIEGDELILITVIIEPDMKIFVVTVMG